MFFHFRRQNKEQKILPLVVPLHIAIIPDGNRRWARKRGLPAEAGHREGAEVFKRIVTAASDIGIRFITFYAFSTENWSRSEKEVKSLMDLLLYFLKNAEKDLAGKNVRIKVIGKKSGLTEEIFKEINRVEDSTRRNDGLVINLAINYGGREEILGAVKNISEKVKNNELKTEEITPEAFSALLYSNGCPDPDLLIRTSGEMRISNFLLWQMAYTEYWFTDKLWPDFNKSDLEEAVSIYSGRSRRYGL